MARPFKTNPLHQPLARSPLQKGHRVILLIHWLTMAFLVQMRLSGIDRLSQFILQHRQGFYCTKKIYSSPTDNSRSTQRITTCWVSSLMANFILICTVLSVYKQAWRNASERLLLFFPFLCNTAIRPVFIWTISMVQKFPAEVPTKAFAAFHELQSLFDHLELQSSRKEDCLPAMTMQCLGIKVNTITFTLRIPRDRPDDLLL